MRERGRSKVRVDIFCEMPERARGRRTRKIIAFATEKRVFGISKNRFCTIPGWNINSVSFRSLKTTIISEGSIPAADSARTRRVKPRFVRFSRRERIWNVRLHARENHLGYTLGTLRGTPPTKAVIIPWDFRKLHRKVKPVSRKKVPQTSPRGGRGPFLRKT